MRIVLPYYIILNHATLILLSEDLQNACLCEAADFVGFYEECFNDYIENSQVLVKHYENLDQILGHYKRLKIRTERLYIMEYEPCFFALMDYPMVEHYLPQEIENRPLMLDMILNHLKEMKSAASTYCLVSHKGIEYFIKTGCMTDVPPGMDVSLSLSDRRLLLIRLREQCRQDASMLRIINPDFLSFPDFVTIWACVAFGTDFSINNQKSIYRFLYITEHTLSKAWASYIESSLDSPMVYGKEKTLQLIDEYIEFMGSENSGKGF